MCHTDLDKNTRLERISAFGSSLFFAIYIISSVALVGKYRKHVLDLGFIGPPRPHVAMRSLCPTNLLRKWPRRLSPAWVVVFAPRLVWVEIVHCIPWFRTTCCTVMLRGGSTVCTAQRCLCFHMCLRDPTCIFRRLTVNFCQGVLRFVYILCCPKRDLDASRGGIMTKHVS